MERRAELLPGNVCICCLDQVLKSVKLNGNFAVCISIRIYFSYSHFCFKIHFIM